jgi:hypothetical protein
MKNDRTAFCCKTPLSGYDPTNKTVMKVRSTKKSLRDEASGKSASQAKSSREDATHQRMYFL